MARGDSITRLSNLLKKQEQIAEQLKQLKAREKETERKADTRRKVIAGALALEHFEKNPNSEFARTLFMLLDQYVDARSRALFPFLPPVDPGQTNEPRVQTFVAANESDNLAMREAAAQILDNAG